MPSSRLNQRHVLAAVVVILCISAMLPSRLADWVSYAPRSIVAAALNPLTQPLTRVGTTFRAPAAPAREMPPQEQLLLRNDDLTQENAALRHQLDEAVRRLAEYQVMDEYAIRLQINLDGLGRISAPVAQSYDYRLILSQGRTRGLRPDLIVVSGPHLVGQITEATALSSTVRLITSPDNASLKLGVRILGSPSDPARADFDVPMQLQLRDGVFTAQCRITDPIQAGDVAVMADRRWRSEAMGFFVGRVTRVAPDPNDQLHYQIITVEPMALLAHLDHVVALAPAVE